MKEPHRQQQPSDATADDREPARSRFFVMLAVIFGGLQVLWLGYLGWVAWKVLS